MYLLTESSNWLFLIFKERTYKFNLVNELNKKLIYLVVKEVSIKSRTAYFNVDLIEGRETEKLLIIDLRSLWGYDKISFYSLGGNAHWCWVV